MADQKISDLPAVTTPVGSDELELLQSGDNKRMTLAQLLGMGTTAATFPSITTTAGMATSGGAFAVTRAASSNAGAQFKVSGDSQQRLQIDANGKMSWGTGAAAADVTIERSGTSTLKLTGDWLVDGSLWLDRVGDAAGVFLIVRRDAGQVGSIAFRTGTNSTRATFYITNEAESGSDAGSNVKIDVHDDSGSLIGTAMKITRATGAVEFGDDLNVIGDLSVATSKLTVAAASGNITTQGTIGGQAGAWFRESALALGATTGHVYIPSCAGVPTGVPATKTGQVALQFDSTNDDLYVYDGGWIKVALT